MFCTSWANVVVAEAEPSSYSSIQSGLMRTGLWCLENLVPLRAIHADQERLKFLTVTMTSENNKPMVMSHDKMTSTQNVKLS